MRRRALESIDSIVIHCSASPFGCARVIDQWHTDPRKPGGPWDAIGYHDVILSGRPFSGSEYDPCLDGTLEVGREPWLVGAHVRGHNHTSLGLCLIGDRAFTRRQFETLRMRVHWLQRMHSIPDGAVYGHRELDAGKTCPNVNMDTLRAYLFAVSEKEARKILETLPLDKLAA